MKICANCHKKKTEDCFHKDNKSADGLASYCKQCKKEKRKKYYKENPITGTEWDKKNPEKAKERQRKYRESIKKAVDKIVKNGDNNDMA